jgi:hypothetical protein
MTPSGLRMASRDVKPEEGRCSIELTGRASPQTSNTTTEHYLDLIVKQRQDLSKTGARP